VAAGIAGSDKMILAPDFLKKYIKLSLVYPFLFLHFKREKN
jgi:hypothetical protein